MDIVVFTQYLKYDKIIQKEFYQGELHFMSSSDRQHVVIPKGTEAIECEQF